MREATAAPAFVLAKPDTVVSGRLQLLLERLCASDVRVISYLARRAGEEDVRRFHDRGRFQWWHDDWRLNAALFSHGPAVGLLLESTANAHATDIHCYLRAQKGGALPRSWHAGSLRYVLGRSRVCNGIHIADDPREMMEEAIHWFRQPASTLRDLAAAEQFSATHLIQRLSDHAYSCGLRFDGIEVALRLMIRVLDAALITLVSNSPAALASEQLRHQLVSVAEGLSAASGRLERDKVLLDGWPRLSQASVSIYNALEKTSRTNPAATNTASVFTAILKRSSLCLESLEPLRYVASLWDTYASDLEHFLVTSACRYGHAEHS